MASAVRLWRWRRSGEVVRCLMWRDSYRGREEGERCLVSLFLYIAGRIKKERRRVADVGRTRDGEQRASSDVDNGVGADLSNRKRS